MLIGMYGYISGGVNGNATQHDTTRLKVQCQ